MADDPPEGGIFESTADKYARRDVNVLFLDRRDSLESWFLNQNNPETRALLDHAAVLSLSMAFVAKGNPADQTVGSLTTAADIEAACSLWQNSHTLLVWSIWKSLLEELMTDSTIRKKS